jgi:hypothetical protein
LVVYDTLSVLALGWWLSEGGFSGRPRVYWGMEDGKTGHEGVSVKSRKILFVDSNLRCCPCILIQIWDVLKDGNLKPEM